MVGKCQIDCLLACLLKDCGMSSKETKLRRVEMAKKNAEYVRVAINNANKFSFVHQFPSITFFLSCSLFIKSLRHDSISLHRVVLDQLMTARTKSFQLVMVVDREGERSRKES